MLQQYSATLPSTLYSSSLSTVVIMQQLACSW